MERFAYIIQSQPKPYIVTNNLAMFDHLQVVTTEVLAPLRHLLGMVLLELRATALLGSLVLEALNVGASVADLDPRGLEGAVGLLLCALGVDDAVPGLADGGVEVAVAAAKLVQEATAATGRAVVVGGVAGG